jgi:hypothetical protein
MYPWLSELWECGHVGEDNVDDETIDVRSNGKNMSFNHEGG